MKLTASMMLLALSATANADGAKRTVPDKDIVAKSGPVEDGTAARQDCDDIAYKCDLQFFKYFGDTAASCPALADNAAALSQCYVDIGCSSVLGAELCYDTTAGECPTSCAEGVGRPTAPASNHDLGAYANCDAASWFTCWSALAEMQINSCSEAKQSLLGSLSCAQAHNCPVEDIRANAYKFDCELTNTEFLAQQCGAGVTCQSIANELLQIAPAPPVETPPGVGGADTDNAAGATCASLLAAVMAAAAAGRF